jgi:hypothetical protein
MNDDELHSLIRQTQPKPEFPASFQREVWSRITVAEQQSWVARWRRWSQDLFLWMAQPAPAVAMVTTMLILGAGLGSLTAPDRNTSALRTAYDTSINPLKAAHVAMPE